MEFLSNYSTSIMAIGIFGLLVFVQLLMADFTGIWAKHAPGSPVAGGHDDFFFRAHRAHANTNESIGIFILFVLFAFLSGADPDWTGKAIWSYVGFRTLHALFYYFNVQTMRSVVFGLSLIAMGSLFVLGVMAN